MLYHLATLLVLVFQSSLYAAEQNLIVPDNQFSRNLYTWEILESETAFKHIQASPASANLTAISVDGNHFTFASGVWFQTNYSIIGPNETIKTWNEDFNVKILITESGKIYCLNDSPNVPYFIGNTSSNVSVIIAKLNEGTVPFLEMLLSETQTITSQVYIRVLTANAKDISCTFSNYSCWLLVGNNTIQYFQWHSPLGKISLMANFNITGYSFSSVSAYQSEVWLIAADGATAWRRLGVTSENPIGNRWMVFTLNVPFQASKVTIGAGGIYVLLNGGVVAKYQGFELSSAQTPSTIFEIDTYDDGKLLGIVETGQMIQSSIVNVTPTSYGNLVAYDSISKIWTAPSGLATHELKNIAVGEATIYALKKGTKAYPYQIGLGLNQITKHGNEKLSCLSLGAGANNIFFMVEDSPSDTHLYCDTFISGVPYLRIEDQNATGFGHFAIISCGEAHCWGINNNGTSAFISLKQINPCSENFSNSHLRLIEEGIIFKTIDTSRNGETWAVEAKTNDAFIRLGVDNDTLNGTMWAPIPGVSLRDVAVGRDIAYGIGVNGEFFHLGTKDGNWTSWSLWTHCSTSCNGGVQQRRRYCHHPAPRYGGSNCTGSNIDTRTCNEQICKGYQWSDWSSWTACDGNCPVGESTRTRSCVETTNFTDNTCTGSNQESLSCLNQCLANRTVTVEKYIKEPWQDVRHGYTCQPFNDFMSISAYLKKMMLYFENVTIPKSAVVIDAYIQFTCKTSFSSSHHVDVLVVVNAEEVIIDELISCNFSALNYSSSVAWHAGPWQSEERGPAQRTPNLANIVQELRGAPSWNGNSPMVFSLRNVTSGYRYVYSFDGDPLKCPMLHIRYNEEYLVPLNTSWTSWSSWTNCSHPCFTGKQNRTRKCKITDGNLYVPASHCPPGQIYDEQICNKQSCYELDNCTLALDEYGGQVCCMLGMELADSSNYSECFLSAGSQQYQCPLDRYGLAYGACIGTWSNWTLAQPCNVTCGEGYQTWSRTCLDRNGIYQLPSVACNGFHLMTNSCSLPNCSTSIPDGSYMVSSIVSASPIEQSTSKQGVSSVTSVTLGSTAHAPEGFTVSNSMKYKPSMQFETSDTQLQSTETHNQASSSKLPPIQADTPSLISYEPSATLQIVSSLKSLITAGIEPTNTETPKGKTHSPCPPLMPCSSTTVFEKDSSSVILTDSSQISLPLQQSESVIETKLHMDNDANTVQTNRLETTPVLSSTALLISALTTSWVYSEIDTGYSDTGIALLAHTTSKGMESLETSHIESISPSLVLEDSGLLSSTSVTESSSLDLSQHTMPSQFSEEVLQSVWSEYTNITKSSSVLKINESTSSEFAPAEVSVHPGHGAWAQWGECSVSCGKGIRIRYSECNDANVCNNAIPESSACENHPCPVNGEWTSWSAWSTCDRTCDGGTRASVRSCTNPPPQHNGHDCDGSSKRTEECNLQICQVDGGWGQWTPWGHCDKPCNDGYRRRFRFCDSPRPKYNGRNCLGAGEETMSCNANPCSSVIINVSTRFKYEKFTNDLLDRNSTAFKNLKRKIRNNLLSMYKNSSVVLNLTIISFKEGSVISKFTVNYKELSTVELVILATSLDEKKLLGSMPVGFSELNSTDVLPPPDSLTAEAISSTTIRLYWISFASIFLKYSSNFTGFLITYKKTADSDTEGWHRIATQPNSSSIDVTYLIPYVLYTFRVTAMTNTGLGIPSQYVDAFTQQGVPVSPPANFSCQPAHEACLFCEWKEIPRDSLHGELLQYQINYRVYSRSHANMTTEWSNITIPCTQRTYMVENLAAYTRYELELVGSTAAGSSPPAWTQAKTNEGVPTLSPQNITVSSSEAENAIHIHWTQLPREHWNGKPFGVIIYYKVVKNGSAAILNGAWQQELLQPDETHHQVKGLSINMAVSFYLAGVTSLGEGVASSPIRGETCHCNRILYVAWYDRKPYVTTSDNLQIGIFPELISSIVKNVCGYCKAYGYTKVYYDRSRTGKSPIRVTERDLRAKVDDEVHLHFPVSGNKAVTVLEGKYQYVQVIDDTGSVFIGIDQNNAAKSEKIMQILYTSYPVVLIIALFMVTTGMILWFADQAQNPDELQRGHFFRGVLNGAWWAFITMTTVGYGDIAPKSFSGRVVAVVWIIIGLVLSSIFVSTLTTAIIVASVNEDVKLYGTKVAALYNSPEYWLGCRRLSRVTTTDVKGKSFTTAKELLQAVINGQVKGALLEANEASTLLDFISANGLRVIKQIETNKGIGMLLSGEMTTLHADIRTYVQNNQDMISKLLKNGTMELEIKSQASRSNSVTRLFDSKSALFRLSLKFTLIIFGALFIFGLLWQFCLRSGIKRLKRVYPKTKEDVIRERYFKATNELFDDVEKFVTSYKKRVEDLFESQMRARFQLVIKHSKTTPYGPKGWIRYRTLNTRHILSEIKAQEIINENVMRIQRRHRRAPNTKMREMTTLDDIDEGTNISPIGLIEDETEL